jgi:hypothetical protein
LLALATWAPAAGAQETFQVLSVNTLGCNSGNFGMTVERANLDGGSYTVHTVVTVDALIYMNEAASISINGLSGWNVFNNFTYGPVPNPGTYPIPAGQEMRLDFFLERPIGTYLYAWTLIVDGCDTGNILYNGPTEGVGSWVQVPTLSPVGMVVLAGALLLAFVWMRRRRATQV